MSSIPASDIVQVLPGVISAGGRALVMNGLVLTSSTRVPVGMAAQLTSPLAVSNFFGPSSSQAAGAPVYYSSFLNSQQKPGNLIFVQYNPQDVAAYLQSGKITALGLAAIQALSGSLTITVDNAVRTNASFSLASATSYSAAAALIQTALNAALPQEAQGTAAIAGKTATLTGTINGYTLTVTAASGDPILPGTVLTGTGVLSGTKVTEQLTQIGATAGGTGTYALKASASQIILSESMTGAYGLMTVSAIISGTFSVGQTLSGTGVTASTLIAALGTGTGLTGTYVVSPSQTTASTTITASATALTVTFDSISGSFLITSGITGAASQIGFATGTLALPLLMTQQTGAILSQGANAAIPGQFMDYVVNYITQNWATFWTDFDPDFGSGNTKKLAFSAWTNNQNKRYAYNAADTDVTPTNSTPALQSLGYLIGPNAANYDGVCPIWDPNGENLAWFLGGYPPSLNFNARNGRTTMAYRHTGGIIAPVTDKQTADNLRFNGYNSYGAWATANDNFVGWFDGTISGEFLWYDSYIDQIRITSQLQLAGMNLLFSMRAIPYNQSGYAKIEGALHDPAAEGLNFGSIVSGVTLSQEQKDEITNTVGEDIIDTLVAKGYYIQVQDASPQVRAARASPPVFFFYLDGQSVHKLTINSLEVQ
jgi:Protein of unknown function (DUF3383)